VHQIVVADIALDELRRIRHCPTEPGCQIVEHENVFAGVEQLERHMAADKAGAACDQDAHGTTPRAWTSCNSLLAIGNRLRDF
jgi:hypothetical protein